jgi:hypothetical protein
MCLVGAREAAIGIRAQLNERLFRCVRFAPAAAHYALPTI